MAAGIGAGVPPAAADARRDARRVALAMAPGVLMAGLGGGMAFPIVPHVGRQAGLSLAFIGLILAANRIGRVLTSPAVGAAVDRVGGRRVLLWGLAVQQLALALYVAAIALHRPGALFLLGRAAHGLASACVFVSSQALALRAGGSRYRGYVGGVVRSAQAAGVPLGLLAGGLLSGLWGPIQAFLVAAAVTAVAMALAAHGVPDLRARAAPAATLGSALRSLGERQVAALGAVNFTANFAAQGVVLAMMTLMVEERHIQLDGLSSETLSGLLMGLMTLCMVGVTPRASRLADVPGRRASLLALGLAAMIPGMIVLGAARTGGTLAASLALVGLGTGLLTPPLLTLLADVVPPARQGSAVGALQLCGDLGGSLGPIVATALFAAHQAAIFAGTAALLGATLPVTLFLRRRESVPA